MSKPITALTEVELDVLWALHLLLQDFDAGFSIEVLEHIGTYLHSLPDSDLLSRTDAFDLQVSQRVLPLVVAKLQSQSTKEIIREQLTNVQELLDLYTYVSPFHGSRRLFAMELRKGNNNAISRAVKKEISYSV
ncbi:hypothetical protein [Aureibacillus halotolerans]|uniref:hypothetical protein n=1 Tax=Aureibacillus halotolerans TaxID=1508390 RepID=UPI00105D5840|nr:hypothetical protein [Aureibacillus halotolerans]